MLWLCAKSKNYKMGISVTFFGKFQPARVYFVETRKQQSNEFHRSWFLCTIMQVFHSVNFYPYGLFFFHRNQKVAAIKTSPEMISMQINVYFICLHFCTFVIFVLLTFMFIVCLFVAMLIWRQLDCKTYWGPYEAELKLKKINKIDKNNNK